MPQHPSHTNRLINQKSPYLLQHAHNPVDWYPWGDEAFQAAKDENKPIFLSIGYATCHWCHTMEKECFEDEQIAGIMNDTFVNIKVDREELPEVDSLYMEFAQTMMTGAAGWPLNVILTPDLRPFFAATYLPPHSRHGMIGLSELAVRIHELWHGEEREGVISQSEKLLEAFADSVHGQGDSIPPKEEVDDLAELIFHMGDPVHGGTRGHPKFPIGYQWSFILHYFGMKKDSRALFLVERTLDKMHEGGIYDHLGGGFSRYSVDDRWLVPHFEKMLYDNALVAYCYLEAWQVMQKPLYKTVCQEICDYVLRDMTHPEGGFYSAEDADSEGKEGLFYTWTPQEIQQVLGHSDADLFCRFYGVTDAGNFEDRNILHIVVPLDEFAAQEEIDANQLTLRLADMRRRLWEERRKRVHPLKDDKILCAWNGLMIATLAEAGAAFGEKRYMESALRAVRFIQKHMWNGQILFRRWRDKEAHFRGGLEDYAFLVRALLSLFEMNGDAEWLDWAVQLTDYLKANFKIEKGAFYQTDGSDPNLLLRKCQFSDGAEPSGNGVHCENLLRLYQLTGDTDYFEQAEDILKAAKKYTEQYPLGYCYHLLALLRYYDMTTPSFAIALNDKEDYFEELRRVIYEHFLPHKAVTWMRKDNEKMLSTVISYIETMVPIDNATTLYMCHEGVCQKPITEFPEMIKAIRTQ